MTKRLNHVLLQTFGLAISVSILMLTPGCEYSLVDGDSSPEREIPELKIESSLECGRNVFTQQEILTLFDQNRYEFQYVVSYLENLGDIIASVAITNNLEQVSFSYDNSFLNMKYYVDMGYEKDEEFERCLKTILIDCELGCIRFFRNSVIYFGPNSQIIHCKYDLIARGGISTNNPEAVGHIEGNWYYYAYDPEFRTGNSIKDFGRFEFTREETIELYNACKYELNYVASYLVKIGREGYIVAILENLEQVCFNFGDFSDLEQYEVYTDLGYEKDEEFELCLRTILIDRELGHLCFNIQTIIYFGPDYSIIYCEYDLFEVARIDRDNQQYGRIEGNWYYFARED